MSAVAFDTVELFFSKSSLQSKPKYMRKNSTGLWLFLCTWMIMTNSIILPKAVFNWKYPTHPLSQLKMQRMRTYQKFVNLDSIVELGPTSFVDSCIYKVSRMFCINIVQPSLELEANNLDFCFEDLFMKKATFESRNFILLKPELNFSSSVNLFEDPSAFFSADRNTVPVIFDTGASLAITSSNEDFVKPSQPLHSPLFLGGMADGLEVMGIGEISWTFVADDNTEVQIFTDGYYVPQGKARSPQRIFNNKEFQGITEVTRTNSLFILMGCLQLKFHIIVLVGYLLQKLFLDCLDHWLIFHF